MPQQPQQPASTLQDAWDLANLKGEHGGLIPSLIASGQAPKELTENFVVVATGTWSNGSSKLEHLKAYMFGADHQVSICLNIIRI